MAAARDRKVDRAELRPSFSLSRVPGQRLRPFVSRLWASAPSAGDGADARERVLPTAATHLVLRLGGEPVRIFSGPGDEAGQVIGRSVVGGARTFAYEKRAGGQGACVGILLRPGAAQALLGAPASEVAHRHVSLEALWSPAIVSDLRERIEEAGDGPARLQILERFLEGRLADAAPDPLVAHMQRRLAGGAAVGAVVADLGFSHRHLSSAFLRATGLSPKTFQRLRRFNRALDRLHRDPCMSLAGLAAGLGYADQAHLSRDFRAFSGLSPGEYRRAAPASARHVPRRT